MSLTDELVKRLRYLAMEFGGFSNNYKLLTDAADTIEELSAKLASANMERSELYFQTNDNAIGKNALIRAIYDSGLLDSISQAEADDLRIAIDSVPLVGVVNVIRCKDCRQWGTGFPAETDHGKVCRYAGYMVGANGYCVYGEK